MVAQIIIEEMKAIFQIMPTIIGVFIIFDLTGSLLFGKR